MSTEPATQDPQDIHLDIWVNGNQAAVEPRRHEHSTKTFVDRIDNLNTDAATLMLSRPDKNQPDRIGDKWRDLEALRRVLLDLGERSKRRTGMEWVGGSVLEVEDHKDRLLRLHKAGCLQLLDRIELDAEEETTNNSRIQVEAAGRRLEEIWDEVEQAVGYSLPPIVLTAIPQIPGDVRVYLRLKRVRLVRGQWYVFQRPLPQGKHWSHRAPRSPRMQDFGAKHIEAIVDAGLVEPEYEAGLACYWQRGLPGYGGDIEQAMEDALLATLVHTRRISYWALAQLYGATNEARRMRRFVQEIKARYGAWTSEEPELPPGQVSIERRIQWLLAARGHDMGSTGTHKDGVDGQWGTKTSKAARVAEGGLGLVADGRPDVALLRGLENEYESIKGERPDFSVPAITVCG